MGFFTAKQRSHLKAVEILPADEITLAPKPKTLDELHMDMLQARSRVVHCQGELARAEQAAEEAEMILIKAVNAIGFSPKLVDRVRGGKC